MSSHCFKTMWRASQTHFLAVLVFDLILLGNLHSGVWNAPFLNTASLNNFKASRFSINRGIVPPAVTSTLMAAFQCINYVYVSQGQLAKRQSFNNQLYNIEGLACILYSQLFSIFFRISTYPKHDICLKLEGDNTYLYTSLNLILGTLQYQL